MKKLILFALIFVVLISIGYSQAPWHSNIHLSRFNVTVYAYLPPTYPDWIQSTLGFFPNYIVTVVPLIIDTKSLSITNCSEIYIYSSNDNDFVYFFVDTRQFSDIDYRCYSTTTQFYVWMTLKYVGYDPGLNMSVYKNVVYFYFNPVVEPSKNYNNFRLTFTSGIEITRFRTFQSGFYEPSDVEKKAYFNFSFVYADIPTPYYSISDYEGLYFQFILIPKVPGTVYFRLNSLDDHIIICEQGYVHPTFLNCKNTILENHLGWFGWPSLPYETSYTINRFTPIMIYFDNDGGSGNFELYIKHETWDIYRKLDAYDDVVYNTFYVLTLGIGVLSPDGTIIGRGVPVLYYNFILGSAENNFGMLANYYPYVFNITIDNTEGSDTIFYTSDGQFPFELNTKEFISKGYLDSQCKNLLIVFGNETWKNFPPFWFDPDLCNSNHTIIYTRIPNFGRQVMYIYVYMSPNPTQTYISKKKYDPISTFNEFWDFWTLSEVYAAFDTSGGVCNNVRYFDVQNGKLVLYPSPCGTRILRRSPPNPDYTTFADPSYANGVVKFRIVSTNDPFGQDRIVMMNRISYAVAPPNYEEYTIIEYNYTGRLIIGGLRSISYLNYTLTNNYYIIDSNTQVSSLYDLWWYYDSYMRLVNRTNILRGEYHCGVYGPYGYFEKIFGSLYNFTVEYDYLAVYSGIRPGFTVSYGVAPVQIAPPPITYTIYLNATDQYNNFVSTNIYINGTGYSTGTSVNLLNATYIISADIPANYTFVRWSSRHGNITFANAFNLTTLIRVWGNDVLTLLLSFTPPAPPARYRVYCYIYTTGGQVVEDAFLIIGDRGCPHEAYLDLDAGTYSLDIYFDTSKYSFNRYSYSGNIYISNIYSKTTSLTVNGNGTITAYLSPIIAPAPPPAANITLPAIPFITYFGFDKFLLFVLILVVGGILAIENIIVGSSFAISGLILTFLGIDAIAVIIILFAFIISYAIIRILRR